MPDATVSTIMIAGDNSDFSYLMQRYVGQSGWQMLVAGLGEDVVGRVRRERPMAILLEVEVRGTMGWEVLRALKADPSTRDIPVVICSWLEEESHAVAEGAACYLRKPVLYMDFLAALRDAGVRFRA